MPKSMDRIPKQDRPREKLLAKGAGALTDRELLAVLLGKGTPQLDVMSACRQGCPNHGRKGPRRENR